MKNRKGMLKWLKKTWKLCLCGVANALSDTKKEEDEQVAAAHYALQHDSMIHSFNDIEIIALHETTNEVEQIVSAKWGEFQDNSNGPGTFAYRSISGLEEKVDYIIQGNSIIHTFTGADSNIEINVLHETTNEEDQNEKVSAKWGKFQDNSNDPGTFAYRSVSGLEEKVNCIIQQNSIIHTFTAADSNEINALHETTDEEDQNEKVSAKRGEFQDNSNDPGTYAYRSVSGLEEKVDCIIQQNSIVHPFTGTDSNNEINALHETTNEEDQNEKVSSKWGEFQDNNKDPGTFAYRSVDGLEEKVDYNIQQNSIIHAFTGADSEMTNALSETTKKYGHRVQAANYVFSNLPPIIQEDEDEEVNEVGEKAFCTMKQNNGTQTFIGVDLQIEIDASSPIEKGKDQEVPRYLSLDEKADCIEKNSMIHIFTGGITNNDEGGTGAFISNDNRVEPELLSDFWDEDSEFEIDEEKIIFELENEKCCKRWPTRTPVFLNVYNLTCANRLFSWAGIGAFHSGVEVYGREYSFGATDNPGSGVWEDEPRKCSEITFRKSILIGWTSLDLFQFHMFMEHISSRYSSDSYHLLKKNCNNFSEDMCLSLTSKSIPKWVNRLARIGSHCCI